MYACIKYYSVYIIVFNYKLTNFNIKLVIQKGSQKAVPVRGVLSTCTKKNTNKFGEQVPKIDRV